MKSAALSTPLPRSVALLSIGLLLIAFIALARFWHGSWARAAAAGIAPGIVALGAAGLWAVERRRGRPLRRRWSAVILIGLAAAAGGAASAIAPTLGSVLEGMLTGVFWGGLLALGWIRRHGEVA